MNADGLFKSQIIRQVEKCIRARLSCLWCSYTVLLAYRQSMMMLKKRKKKRRHLERAWMTKKFGRGGCAFFHHFFFLFYFYRSIIRSMFIYLRILNFFFFFLESTNKRWIKILTYLLLLFEGKSIYNFIVVLSTSEFNDLLRATFR